MSDNSPKSIRIAILDLYDGFPNQGMRCIRELVNDFAENTRIDVEWDEFEIRREENLPDLSYDVYISSGGPGSPLESKDSSWENKFFNWIESVEKYNNKVENRIKKKIFFICHSFQLACRYFEIAQVCQRKSTAFGIFPMHLMQAAGEELVFEGLNNPFYSVDSRDYQVIEPNHNRLEQLGATILAIEKERPHVPYERAIMAVRFNENMIGTQFHPEADAIGMSLHLKTAEKKETVIKNYGLDKWQSMIDHLNDPEKIMWTYNHIIPNFLQNAVDEFALVEV
jgi:homoserine O-succinyltransferase/O-acetyltransferase